MAPHSSTLAWKIPWTEEPGRLQSMGSLGVGRDWATSLSLFAFNTPWRRKWEPTVFLPGKSQERGSLVGCRLWGRTVGHDWSDLAAAAAMIPLIDLLWNCFCNVNGQVLVVTQVTKCHADFTLSGSGLWHLPQLDFTCPHFEDSF